MVYRELWYATLSNQCWPGYRVGSKLCFTAALPGFWKRKRPTRPALPSTGKKGGEPLRAAPYWLEAAEAARNALLLKTAIEIYHKAFSIFQAHADTTRAFEAQYRLASILITSDGGETALAATQVLLDSAHSLAQKAQAYEVWARLLYQIGDVPQTTEAAAKGVEYAAQSGDLQLQAKLLEVLAYAQNDLHRRSEATALVEQMKQIYQQLGDLKGQAQAHWNLGIIQHHAQHKQALQHFIEAERLCAQTGTSLEWVRALNSKGVMLFELGQTEEALESYNQAQKLLDGTRGDVLRSINLLHSRARALYALGEYAEAFHCLHRGLELGKGTRYNWVLALHSELALLYRFFGQMEIAREQLHQAAQWPASQPGFLVRYLVVKAMHKASTGQSAEATFEQAWQLAESLEDAHVCAQILLERSTTVPAAQGKKMVEDALKVAQAHELEGLVVAGHTRLARMLLELGQPSAALEHSEKAVLSRTLSPLVTPAEVWLTHGWVLEALNKPESTQYLNKAIRWVKQTAEQRIPPEFKQGFLEHNPISRAVLQQAAQYSG